MVESEEEVPTLIHVLFGIFFLFYAKSSRPEKKPWFKEDEATIGREAEVAQAPRIKLRAAKKRKAEAI
ncbi:hypothetical protein DAPPUDRAFT_331562 [Daphnia pulex]|uniref:Uncharacterized protein n=1 Tax=Daphnia pulex TaxID=6669 RepID=E9HMT5_DAPPU|nr:hypothetical protein DAPPUDRAFT_331562 [Daphnia pulex]|eukprot:EFX66948.1 hypothetical protein DAPPUDRAFT_331562 [Daphnia pulex]